MKNPFFSRLNDAIKQTNDDEYDHAGNQRNALMQANSSRDMALKLLPSVLAHLIKLIKSLLFLALTLTAYVLTWLPCCDPNVKVQSNSSDDNVISDLISVETLKQSTLIKQCLNNEVKAILWNLVNAILAFAQPFTRLAQSRKGYDSSATLALSDQKLLENTWNFFTPDVKEVYNSIMGIEEKDDRTTIRHTITV